MIAFDKEMGLTHQDIFRLLESALGSRDFRREGMRVVLEGDGKCLEITLSEESRRRAGSLELPVTKVRLRFTGYTPDEAQTALDRFDAVYRRAGG